MSDREAQEDREQDDRQTEGDVAGVDLDPGEKNKSIAVDTTERLQHKEQQPDFDELPDEELEKERQARLDPENRPDNVEVDNSDRTFNPETGLFEDSDVEPPEGAPFDTTEGEASGSESKKSQDQDSMDPMDAADDDAEDPKDRTEATDAEQSKEAKESKATEG